MTWLTDPTAAAIWRDTLPIPGRSVPPRAPKLAALLKAQIRARLSVDPSDIPAMLAISNPGVPRRVNRAMLTGKDGRGFIRFWTEPYDCRDTTALRRYADLAPTLSSLLHTYIADIPCPGADCPRLWACRVAWDGTELDVVAVLDEQQRAVEAVIRVGWV